MKLNNDCVRDLMLYIEERVDLYDSVSIKDINLNNYSLDEMIYTTSKLHEAGYINARIEQDFEVFDADIFSLTWNGHKFLDNIRDNNVWKTTKGIVSKFSSVSLGIIENVSAQVITNIITQQIGQPPQ